MNLVTRLVFSTFLVCLLAAGWAAAQKPVGPTPNNLNPTTGKTPKITTAPPVSAERGTYKTGERSNGAAASKTSGLKPSPTTLRNSAAARPSATAKQPTAKSVYRSPKKVAPVQAVEKINVQWLTLEQALEKCKYEKRKIFVDVYTDWCGWCKHMDSTTFGNAVVAKYLNEHYYAVKLNAEQTQDIVFKEKTYHFKKTGSRGYHELAALWLNNRLSYPTVVVLDEFQNLIQPVPGYQDAVKMEAIINYFGSDSHKKVPWETYEKSFNNRR